MGLLRKNSLSERLSLDGSSSIPAFSLPPKFTQRAVTKTALGLLLIMLLAAGGSLGYQATQSKTNIGRGASKVVPKVTLNTTSTKSVSQSHTPSTLRGATSQKDSQSKVNINTNETSQASNSSVQVNVNGKNIPVPANGTLNESINTNNGSLSVSVNGTTTETGVNVNGAGGSTNVSVSKDTTSNISVQSDTFSQ